MEKIFDSDAELLEEKIVKQLEEKKDAVKRWTTTPKHANPSPYANPPPPDHYCSFLNSLIPTTRTRGHRNGNGSTILSSQARNQFIEQLVYEYKRRGCNEQVEHGSLKHIA
ncbi:Uncharacterized protein Fot_18301 [Forsythia ovata]|uniref:Uncharacterized protein n=1 Tax=Forsythia ovata TaxID=205694 RepID=A0ABD1VHS7_9LAMI